MRAAALTFGPSATIDRQSDVFAVQDEITENVVASIEPHLYAAENRRFQSKPPGSIDAWGYVMRAMPQIWARGEKIETALGDLKRAIAIKPDYARAHSLLASVGIHHGRAHGMDPVLDCIWHRLRSGAPLSGARR